MQQYRFGDDKENGRSVGWSAAPASANNVKVINFTLQARKQRRQQTISCHLANEPCDKNSLLIIIIT